MLDVLDSLIVIVVVVQKQLTHQGATQLDCCSFITMNIDIVVALNWSYGYLMYPLSPWMLQIEQLNNNLIKHVHLPGN